MSTAPETGQSHEQAAARADQERSVADFVFDEISRRVVAGEYRPGQRLVEADLTRDLGVSRSSVREALRRLEHNSFIRLEPNRGATVAAPNRAEIEAMFRVREVIAGLGARAAAERIDLPGNREKIVALLDQVTAQEHANRVDNHRTENGVFHRTINTMSAIDAVGQLMDQFNFPILHAIYFRDLQYDHWRLNLVDHMDIGRAILHGDGYAAEHFARKHMQRMVPIAIEICEQLAIGAKRRS